MDNWPGFFLNPLLMQDFYFYMKNLPAPLVAAAGKKLLVLLSASVETFCVSRKQDFFKRHGSHIISRILQNFLHKVGH